MRTPRVKLPDGAVRLVEPDFAGRLNGFTLLFEAFVLMLSREMPFSAVARIVGESDYKVLAICEKYVDLACEQADYSMVTDLPLMRPRAPKDTTTSRWGPMLMPGGLFS